VSRGVDLANNIYLSADSTGDFKDIAERLLTEIPHAQTLIICADGDINRLNIAALPYQDGYITDYYAVRNIGSVSDIVYPQMKKPIQSALMFNAPYYEKGIAASWGILFGSELEGQIITDTLSKKFGIAVDSLHGKAASKEGLLNRLGGKYGIIHISTHGSISNGEVSIVTAGANLSSEDTQITDRELSEYTLGDTSVAVFALCFGAMQMVSPQDSLSGFIKALLLSGVNSVIAPIHPIDDISAVVLLNEFYNAYLTGAEFGGNAEQALRIAVQRTRNITKSELLREYGVELDTEETCPFSAPKHWMPWVCFSNECEG
jgi:CHAT domain-containing protein